MSIKDLWEIAQEERQHEEPRNEVPEDPVHLARVVVGHMQRAIDMIEDLLTNL